jgi:hypothetical protein
MSEITVERLAEFARWFITEGSWRGAELCGGDIQDKAEALGLITPCTFDPKVHGESDEIEEGDAWFVLHPALAALRPQVEKALPKLEREEVARVIDPIAFEAHGQMVNGQDRMVADETWLWRLEIARSKADAVLRLIAEKPTP